MRRQQVDHRTVPVVDGVPERRVVVDGVAWIDVRAAFDEEHRGAERVRARGHVQGTLPAGVLQFARHAGVEEERERVGTIVLRRGKQRLR